MRGVRGRTLCALMLVVATNIASSGLMHGRRVSVVQQHSRRNIGAPKIMRLRGGAAPSPVTAGKPGVHGEAWLRATVYSWRELSASTACVDDGTPMRHIYEMELDVETPSGLPEYSLQYAPGDCIAIKSPNPPALVIALVNMLSPCRYAGC